MEGLASKTVVADSGIHQLPGWIRNAPSATTRYPPFLGLQWLPRRCLCLERASISVSSSIGFKVSSSRACQTWASHQTRKNTQTNAREDVIVSSDEEIQGLQWELQRVCSVISDWFSRLNNKSRGELKERIGRAGLFLITVALFIINVSGRYCRPALAGTEARTSQPATTQTHEVKGKGDKGKEFLGNADLSLEEKEKIMIEYLKIHPTDVQALEIVLYARMKNGDIAESIKTVEKLIALQPSDLEWKLVKAQLHEFGGEIEEARREYQEILEFKPLSVRALQGLAMIMHKCGEDAAMVEMLEGALERALREKKNSEAYNLKLLLGHMYIVQDKLQQALEHYERLTEEDPNDFRPYLCQGIIYSVLERKDEAEQRFTKYRKLVPQNFPNRGFLDEIMFSAKAESQKREKEAEKLAQGKKLPTPMKQPGTGGKI
eukprot:Gb_41698 [translate_table: standard]